MHTENDRHQPSLVLAVCEQKKSGCSSERGLKNKNIFCRYYNILLRRGKEGYQRRG